MSSTKSVSSVSSTTSTLTNSSDKQPLNPVTPLESRRHDYYEDTAFTPKDVFPSGPLRTGNGDLDCYMHGLSGITSDWKQYIHVDGKPYFLHRKLRIVTEANVRNLPTLTKLEKWYAQVNHVRLTKKPDLVQSENVELYLTLYPEQGYYYVDHGIQSVFWLEDLPIEKLGLKKRKKPRSFELFIERNYYRHLENFPVHSKLPAGAEELLRGALVHACTEHITSRDSSTTVWNADDCQKFLSLLDSLNSSKDVKDGSENDKIELAGYKTWFVSRLFCNILYSRWLYNYGANEAITDRLVTLDQQQRRSNGFGRLGDILSSVLFLCAPSTYVDRLEKLWADRIVSLDGWQKLLTSLLTEWSDSNLLATVTLSANMALLALSDINEIARTASISSSLFAVGSIVIGLHHVWRHRVKTDTTATQAAVYLSNSTRRIPSLKILAFFLSLPVVLLSWSLIFFTGAVASYAFYSGRALWSYSLMGVVLGLVLGIVLSTLVFFWGIFESGHPRWSILGLGVRPRRNSIRNVS